MQGVDFAINRKNNFLELSALYFVCKTKIYYFHFACKTEVAYYCFAYKIKMHYICSVDRITQEIWTRIF